MKKDYLRLASNVKSRINPEALLLEKSYLDEIGSISYSDVLVFIRTAMKSVEPEYTKRSKDAGEKVKEHLKAVLHNVEYEYQGSVMTNTHIRGYSDIDLLVINTDFYGWDSVEVKNILGSFEKRQRLNPNMIQSLDKEMKMASYPGDPCFELRRIRTTSETKMLDIYTECDITKPKAIRIKNKNLNREVDIVTANWFDDVFSIIYGKGIHRGVQIYNKDDNKREKATFPFVSIDLINKRSKDTGGRLKKMIRFLKNCKAESTIQIGLSSFDINAICYAIETKKYEDLSFYELVPIMYFQLKKISEDDQYADDLVSVDGREYIFRYDSEKRENLKQLLMEVESIYSDLVQSKIVL